MYDGYCESTSKDDTSNFKAFNQRNCVLIIEDSNLDVVSKACSEAKVFCTDTEDYVSMLTKNIVKAFMCMFR